MGNRAVVAVDALTPPPPHHTHTSAKCSLLILPSTICEKKKQRFRAGQTGAGAPVPTVIHASFNNTLLHDFLFFFPNNDFQTQIM